MIDDSDVVVDGAVEAAEESSIESDDVDAMFGGGSSRMAREPETGFDSEGEVQIGSGGSSNKNSGED